MKIAYLTNYQNQILYDSQNLFSYISDRRRVVGWAMDRGHELIVNHLDTTDAAVFSVLSDFRQLKSCKSKWKVLDMVDGYLNLGENAFVDCLRGLKRADRYHRSIRFSKRLQYACKIVDSVVVGSPEQAKEVKNFNKNVHVILDNQSEFGVPKILKDYKDNSEKTILWEGLSATLPHLLSVAKNLDIFLKASNSTLIVLSNDRTKISKFATRTSNTKDLLAKNFPLSKNQVQFYTWSIQDVITLSNIADFAIIPLNMKDNLAIMKPENKLLIMLSLGLRTLVSPIHSYSRVCDRLSLNNFLVHQNDWSKKLEQANIFLDSQVDKTKVHKYLQNTLSQESLHSAWDKAFGI